MAKEDFVKFYQDYLPKKPDLQAKIDKLTNEEAFAKAVLDEGPKAGFTFSRQDVETVMKASELKVQGAELSDAQLDGVAGGAGAIASLSPTVEIRSLDSVANLGLRLKAPAMESTIMCCW
jgi:hypothetical protein